MPGQKFESKQRITVRNLRIREDTAKVKFTLNTFLNMKTLKFVSLHFIIKTPFIYNILDRTVASMFNMIFNGIQGTHRHGLLTFSIVSEDFHLDRLVKGCLGTLDQFLLL